jgi:hypothetical protein
MFEIVENEGTRIFRRQDFFREAPETIDNPHLLTTRAKRPFETTLGDLAGGKRMIGDDRRFLPRS